MSAQACLLVRSLVAKPGIVTAWIALRVITGKDLKFDSFAPEAERAKRAKAWSEWWKKEGDAAKPAAGS
jgi:hypothetical protein